MDLATLVHSDRSLMTRQYSSPAHYSPPLSSQDHDRKSGPRPALAENPYARASYQHNRTPQSPPTPPTDEQPKCSLPRISNLLMYADGASSNAQQTVLNVTKQISPTAAQPGPLDYRSAPSQVRPGETTATKHPSILPPSPPGRLDGVLDGRQSPLTASQQSASTSYYFGSAINNVDASTQRQALSPRSRAHHSLPPSYNSSPAGSLPSYFNSPASVSGQSVYSQRSLPQFSPGATPLTMTPATSVSSSSNGQNPWQHHHYISASAQAQFPPSQDRYICQTCNKAFSRPSSLRIHGHSHTGEKPFKCPHQGCGKAFSVRSNMKRHERGCHSSSPSSM